MVKNTIIASNGLQGEDGGGGEPSSSLAEATSSPTERTAVVGGEEEEENYFTSYSDVNVHRLMLQDLPRTQAYRDAILNNAHVFHNKIVMDVGAGTGILSLFAMQAGARQVFAVEASPLAEVLREIVKLNDEKGVIEVIHGRAEDIDLPVQVDIIISEWMGFYLLHESMLDSVIRARDKHLQEDGVMFPSHASLYAAPVQLDSYMEDMVGFWTRVYGFDMTPMAQKAVENKLSGGQPEVVSVSANDMLAEPAVVTEFDLRWVQLDETRAVRDKKFVSLTRAGKFHGLALWFDAVFRPHFYEEELVDSFKPVTLSTSPRCPPTHWKQTVIVIPREDQDVEADEVVGWELRLEQGAENPRHYQLGLGLLDPATEEHPVPCSCRMARCALFAALMEQEEEELQEMNPSCAKKQEIL